MDLPIRTFWLLNSNINRLRAESDIRQLSVASSAHIGAEAIAKAQESLVLELGEVMKVDPIASAVRDQSGFNELKAMCQ